MSCIVPLNFVQIKRAFRLPWVESERGRIAQGVSPAALLTFAARELVGVKVCPGRAGRLAVPWPPPTTCSWRSQREKPGAPRMLLNVPGDEMLPVDSHCRGFCVQSSKTSSSRITSFLIFLKFTFNGRVIALHTVLVSAAST